MKLITNQLAERICKVLSSRAYEPIIILLPAAPEGFTLETVKAAALAFSTAPDFVSGGFEQRFSQWLSQQTGEASAAIFTHEDMEALARYVCETAIKLGHFGKDEFDQYLKERGGNWQDSLVVRDE